MLNTGARLGPYEIVGSLGAGGMGEVYRARDTRLDRDVALKILPDTFAHDPDRLMRFEREAKALASLNHPNIAQIYGVEETGGTRALVMELVDGLTLDERIHADGAGLPFDDAVAIARQVAVALEAAHEAGVIHRDLKPANIKLKQDGVVKVLDFGLAKAFDAAPASETSAAGAATMTSPALTGLGVILGTAGYMSPEQARGRPVDKRADIWAFGLVLFEMLTGRRVYQGETVSDTLAAVLTRPPDLGSLPAGTPAHVRQLLARCLERDPMRRMRDIGEARLALDDGSTAPAPAAPVASRAPAPRRRIVAIAAALTAVAAAAGWWFGSRQTTASGPRPQQVTQLTDQAGEETSPGVSPDGTSFVYASRALGSWDIFVQRIGGRNAISVAADPSRDEHAPAFSPDGASIAFHESDVDGGIFVVGATGESARRVTEFGFHPAWSPDGREIAFCTEEVELPFSRSTTSALWVVPVSGGPPRKLFDGDAVQPAWSPSGARIAFWGADQGQRDIFTVARTGGTPAPVTHDAALDWGPAWSPDGNWLYFASDRGGAMNLWRVRVDPASGAPEGGIETVTLGVHAMLEQPVFSKDGTKLVFRSTLQASNPAAFPFDPATERVGAPRLLFRRTSTLVPSSVSRDGQWLALGNPGERHEDIFICRIDGSDLRRLTDDAARDRVPIWSPDGTQIAFYSNRSGDYQVWIVGRDGGGLHQATQVPGGVYFPLYSASGDRMIVSANAPGRPMFMFDPARPWSSQQPVTLQIQMAEGDSFGATSWSSDGQRLAGRLMNSAGVARSLGIYDLQARTLKTYGSQGPAFPTAWLPDNRRVLGMRAGGQLVVLDTGSGRERLVPLPAGVRITDWAVALSPDGRTLYAGVLERESDIWMVAFGK